MRRWLIFFLLPAGAAGQYAASLASNADRTALVGSYDGTGPWRVLVNGQTVRSGAADQLLLLHADGSLNDAGGRTPLVADGVGFATGRLGIGVRTLRQRHAGICPQWGCGFPRRHH